MAANADETHEAEALSSILTADLLGLDLLELNEIQASFPGDGKLKKSPVDLGLLGLNVVIPELNIPLLSDGSNGGLLNVGDLGLALATAQSSYLTQATGQAATVSEDGAINVDGTRAAEGGSTELDLTALFEQLGLDSVTDQILDVAAIELGAVASAASYAGASSTVESNYAIADAKLSFRSPLVAGLTGTLSSTLSGVGTSLDALVGGDQLLDQLLSSLNINLLNVLQVTTQGGTLAVNGTSALLDAIAADIVTGTISDDTGLVTINLETGEIIVDLEKIVDGGSLNGLDANTPLLDGEMLSTVTQAISGLLSSVVSDTVQAVRDAASNVSVDINVPLEINRGELSVQNLLYNLSLAELLDLSELLGVDLGPVNTVLKTLGTVVDTILPVKELLQLPGLDLLLKPLTGLLDNVLAAVLDQLPENIATVNVSATVNLGELLNGENGVDVEIGEVSLLDGVSDELLSALGLGNLGAALNGVVATPVEGIVNALTAQLVSPLLDQITTLDGLLDSIVTPLLTETVDPLLNALPGLVQVTINHQPTLLGDKDYFEETLGYTGEGAFTVNALNIKVLDAIGGDNELVDLSLASSSVRALAEDSYIPTIDADETVEAGDDLGVDGGTWYPESDVTVVVEDANGTPVSGEIIVTVDKNGDFPADVVYPIPAGAEAGDDYVVVGTDKYGHTATDKFEITEPVTDAEANATADVNANASASASASANADENTNASALASASANAEDNSNASAQVAAQAAAQADASTTATAAANADATAAAAVAANADSSSDASTDVTSAANASAQTAAQAAAQTDASSTSNADATAAANANASAASAAASNADSSSEASAEAAANVNADADSNGADNDSAANVDVDVDADADADGSDNDSATNVNADADADGSDNNADENTNASASASASANADDNSNAAAQVAAQAAAQADATSAASAAANADATSAAAAAANADASSAASTDVTSAANASAQAAAQSAAQADASSASNADATAAANANASAASAAASNADSSTEASAAAAANVNADADADGLATDADAAAAATAAADSNAAADADAASEASATVAASANVAADADADGSDVDASAAATSDSNASASASANASSSSNANASADADGGKLSPTGGNMALPIGGAAALLMIAGAGVWFATSRRRVNI